MKNDQMYWEKEEVFEALMDISVADEGFDWSIAALKAKSQEDWDWAMAQVCIYSPTKYAYILAEVAKFQQEVTAADDEKPFPFVFKHDWSGYFKSFRLTLSHLYQKLSLKTQQFRLHP